MRVKSAKICGKRKKPTMGGMPTEMVLRCRPSSWNFSVRASTRASISSHCFQKASPSGVGTSARRPRHSSSTPSSFSRAWMAAVMAGWEICSCSAAWVTLPRWHTAEK